LQLLRRGVHDDPAVQRHLYPQPRHEIGAAVVSKAHSMIDVSDGLSTDLGHILEESKVSARIYKDKIPASRGASESEVLNGGEEYELIITAAGDFDDLPVTRIGEIIPSPS
jgi:thiamine-monophosphate kinase